MSICGAEKRIAKLAQIAASLLILSSFGHWAPGIKRVNEGVKVGSVVGYG